MCVNLQQFTDFSSTVRAVHGTLAFHGFFHASALIHHPKRVLAPSRCNTSLQRFFWFVQSSQSASALLLFNQRTAARRRGTNSSRDFKLAGIVSYSLSRKSFQQFSIAFRSWLHLGKSGNTVRPCCRISSNGSGQRRQRSKEQQPAHSWG